MLLSFIANRRRFKIALMFPYGVYRRVYSLILPHFLTISGGISDFLSSHFPLFGVFGKLKKITLKTI